MKANPAKYHLLVNKKDGTYPIKLGDKNNTKVVYNWRVSRHSHSHSSTKCFNTSTLYTTNAHFYNCSFFSFSGTQKPQHLLEYHNGMDYSFNSFLRVLHFSNLICQTKNLTKKLFWLKKNLQEIRFKKKAVLTTLKNKKIYLTNSFFIAIKITFFYN